MPEEPSEKPLYEDKQIKIDYHPSSHEDHLLYLTEKSGEELNFVLQRGFLQDAATFPRGELEQLLSRIHPLLPIHLEKEGISVDGLHVAICQAYHEQEERMHIAVSTMKF